MTKIKTILFWTGFFPLLVVVDFTVTYIVLPKVHGIQHYYYHHGYQPNYKTLDYGWGDKKLPFFTNSLGFKDKSQRQVALVNSGRRILFLGDSSTEGVGCTWEETYTGQLQSSFIRPEIEILNGAATAYSPKLFYLKTKYLLEVVKLHFTDLYAFIGISAFQDELVYEHFEPEPTPTRLKNFRTWLDRHSLGYRVLKNALRDFHLFPKALAATLPPKSSRERTSEVSRGEWTLEPLNDAGRHALALETYYMELLAKLCKEHGIKLSISVYPWPQQIRANDLNSIQVLHWKAFAKEHKIDFLNYFPNFIGREPVNDVLQKYFIPGDIHWNKNGHEIIAKGFCDSRINPDAKEICKN